MNDNLKGIVEADETFILTSHKGQHITDIKARKRGGASKYRGLSHEQHVYWLLLIGIKIL